MGYHHRKICNKIRVNIQLDKKAKLAFTEKQTNKQKSSLLWRTERRRWTMKKRRC